MPVIITENIEHLKKVADDNYLLPSGKVAYLVNENKMPEFKEILLDYEIYRYDILTIVTGLDRILEFSFMFN